MIKIGSFGGFSVNFYVNGVLFRVSYPGFGSQAADTFRLARGYSMTFADKTVSQISDAYLDVNNGIYWREYIKGPSKDFETVYGVRFTKRRPNQDVWDGFDNLDGVTIKIDDMKRVIAQKISEWIDTNFE